MVCNEYDKIGSPGRNVIKINSRFLKVTFHGVAFEFFWRCWESTEGNNMNGELVCC